jgi:hypothetical protein
MTHTPGPWREGPTEGIGQKGRLVVVDAAGHKIADCEAEKFPGSINFTRSLSEDAANVRLIRAAPELLAACKEAEHEINETDTPMLLARMRAAIAKAEGAS